MNSLPLVSRDAMNFITTLAGVDTATTNRNSSINGLPRGSINITVDGINSQDETIKNTDGFFSIISPRLDAVEEVTVSTAGQGADNNAQGAVQIKFVTRSGTNRMAGSAYYYIRHPSLNANYWFNNRDLPPDPETGKAPKDQVKLYQPGFRIGGPIVIPKLFDGHNKAFYFFNYEEFRLPSQITPHAHGPAPARRAGMVPLQRHGRRADRRAGSEPARSREGERADRRRSIRRSAGCSRISAPPPRARAASPISRIQAFSATRSPTTTRAIAISRHGAWTGT